MRAHAVRRVKEAWVAKDITALVGLLDPDAVMTVASFHLAGDGRVARIWVVRNPEKLRPWLRDG
ncbi:hypothetical protein ABE83_15340 [Streptomyces sp. CFMR 7]|nr:hypothetical protein ABE83_15340 [Streptomyces sp. CFMR 7]